MGKLVVIKLGKGDAAGNLPVIVQIGEDGSPFSAEIHGQLPADAQIVQQYTDWQTPYLSIQTGPRALGRPKGKKTQFSQQELSQLLQDCRQSSQQLSPGINNWLNSEEFRPVKDKLLEKLDPSEEIRVIIQGGEDRHRRLPWHLWDLFETYTKAEVALSLPEFEGTHKILPAKEKVRILAILGDSKGINLKPDREVLQRIPGAEIEFLPKEPQGEVQRGDISDKLWEQDWDILFFAGHSSSQDGTGKIFINSKDYLTVEDVKRGLSKTIERGLRLAIFNSCDGLKLAEDLGDLQIPVTVVMREPVPDGVAQQFLKHFLTAFAGGKSLYMAVREARERMLDEGLEKEIPGGSWLPAIFQNPAVLPPSWMDLGGIPPCPYRGLFAFREQDRELFFGREGFTEKLGPAVRQKRLVAVVGASGCGKSSVVFAGLIPSLRKKGNWLIAHFRPQNSPFENLAAALLSHYKDSQPMPTADEINGLAAQLKQTEGALYQELERIRRDAGGNKRLVLVADQFEELYTLTPEADRQPFLDCLLKAVNDAAGFTLVLTLRADFYGYALSYRPFADALQDACLNLGPMEKQELEDAISRPAEKRGVRLEEGLAQRLIDDVTERPGYLPLLQFTLTELWAKQKGGKLTNAAYDDIGGVEKSLGDYAENAYGKLSEGDRKRAQGVFIQLVQPGEGTDDTRRLAKKAEVGEDNWDLVTQLASDRLVVTNRNEVTGEETVEIVHEALIRGWGRLQDWMKEHRVFRSWQERLRVAMREWERNQNKEGYLLQGAPLGEAEGYLLQRLEDVSKAERVFINLSLEQEKARQQRELEQERKARKLAQTRTRIAVASTIIVSVVGIFAFWQRNEAIKGQISALAAEAEYRFSANDQLGAALASVKAARQLKQSFGLSANERIQTLAKIQQPIYKIQERNRIEGHRDSVEAVSFSPDGKLLVSGSRDNTVKLWSPDGTLLKTFEGHTGSVSSVGFSPDGKMIVSAGSDETVRLWNLDGILLKTIKVNDTLRNVSFSPDGQLIASVSLKSFLLWNLDGTVFKTFDKTVSVRGVDHVSWSPDGNIIATGSSAEVILWRRDGTFLKRFEIYGGPGTGKVRFSPDGRTIAVANAVTRGKNGNNTVSLFDTKGKFLKTLGQEAASSQPGDLILDMQFSPDGKMIAAASGDNTVRVFEVEADEYLDLQITFEGHIGSVNAVSFSPDGKTIASASSDKTVRLWNIKFPNFLDAGSDVLSFRFNSDGETINTANLYRDGSIKYRATVKHWNISGILLKDINVEEPDFNRRPLRLNNVHFSQDGSLILITEKNKGFQILDWAGNYLHTFDGIEKVRSSAFSSDGKLIATATSDNSIKIWNIDGKLIRSIPNNPNIHNIYFSPNNQNLVVLDDKQLRVLTLDGKLLTTINIEKGWLTLVAFSPDSKIIATADYYDQVIKLWNLDGKLMKSLTHQDKIIVSRQLRSISFSPDGQMIATGSKDLNLWGLDGNLIATIQGHGGDINNISFHPDGKMIGITEEYPTGEGNLGYIPSATFWSFDVDSLLASGCNSIRDYLKTNPNVSESDKHLCDGVERNWVAEGEALARLGDMEGAVTRLEKAKQLEPSLGFDPQTKARQLVASALVEQGKNLAITGDFEAATTKFREALQLDSTLKLNPEAEAQKMAVPAIVEQGRDLARTGNVEGAITQFRKALQFDSTLKLNPEAEAKYLAAPALVTQGEHLAQQGKVKQAIAAYTEAQKLDPSLKISAASWSILCGGMENLEYAADVIYACDRAVALEPGNPSHQALRGFARAIINNVDGAIADLESARELLAQTQPKTDEEKKQLNDLMSNIQTLIIPLREGRNPAAARARHLQGEKMIHAGDITKGIAAYTEAQQIDPQIQISSESWNLMCWYGSLHNYAFEVMGACEKAVATSSGNPYYRDGRGVARAMTGNLAGAIEDFQVFIIWIDNELKNNQSMTDADKALLNKWKVTRQRWLDVLRAGKNPFTPEERKSLLQE